MQFIKKLTFLLSAGTSLVGAGEVKQKIARFVPTPLSADISGLSKNERQALDKIIAASKYLNPIFLEQVWSGNPALKARLEKDTSKSGKLTLDAFHLDAGPWSRLDNNAPFVAGVPAKPAAAGFYPDDMTAEEFEAWVKTLSPTEKELAVSPVTRIIRAENKKLKAVPYSEYYQKSLAPAAALLREAASLTSAPSLKKYLNERAQAFISNDYYLSDLSWMDLDAALEITIGPYETYEDKLFGYKAAFEAFVTIRNEKETKKLEHFGQYLQEIENHLPLENKYLNAKLGASSPIRVVDQVYASGDARRGVTTAAFNLPNDERVLKEKGSKRVMLKNVQEAKFQKVLLPIAKVVLSPKDNQSVDFESFFNHILMHEMMHGLGPHDIHIGGKPSTVRLEMKELGSALEEAKADISSLFALQYLIDKGVLNKAMESRIYITYLASAFRTVRFGIEEAHGKGMALQFNYLMNEGAILWEKSTSRFRIDTAKIKPAVKKLTGEIMLIQAEGSYEKAQQLYAKYVHIGPEMRQALEKLKNVPVDIRPIFPLAGE